MNVKELIEHLRNFPGSTQVLTFDPNGGADFPVTGSVYDHAHGTLELCTVTDEETF